jgi:hypothetical protein
MDPFSIAIGAAIGGATDKFVEKAWDSGEKWIKAFFKNHKPKAQKKATDNGRDFINELAKMIKKIEESNQILGENINSAQDHPDFSALLQKALLTSAQTDSKEKHIILARLVSERLKSEPESILALASKMACDVISYLTVNQLMILGLSVNLYQIRPIPFPPKDIQERFFQSFMDTWLTTQLKIYQEITLRQIDLIHLESLSCLKVNNNIGRDMNVLFSDKNFKFDFGIIEDVKLAEAIKKKWHRGLELIDLTTVGQIIGVSVSDLLTKSQTVFDGWD